MAGSAMVTTVASIPASAEPRTVARTTHLPAADASVSPAGMPASTPGGPPSAAAREGVRRGGEERFWASGQTMTGTCEGRPPGACVG